jgi:hypothetical protein
MSTGVEEINGNAGYSDWKLGDLQSEAWNEEAAISSSVLIETRVPTITNQKRIRAYCLTFA